MANKVVQNIAHTYSNVTEHSKQHTTLHFLTRLPFSIVRISFKSNHCWDIAIEQQMEDEARDECGFVFDDDDENIEGYRLAMRHSYNNSRNRPVFNPRI